MAGESVWWKDAAGTWGAYTPGALGEQGSPPPVGASVMTQSRQPLGVSDGRGGVVGGGTPSGAVTGAGGPAVSPAQNPPGMNDPLIYPVGETAAARAERLNINAANNQTQLRGYQIGAESQAAATAAAREGNQLDAQTRMQLGLMDSQTRERIAQLGDQTQRLEMQMNERLRWADFYRQMGQDQIANDLQYSAMELDKVKVALSREMQQYQQALGTAEFQQSQQQFDRTFGMDVARFGADEANRTFQNQMATAGFQEGQNQFAQQHALDRGRFGLDQQSQAANQALQYSNFGLDQQRFGLEKQKAQAEMAANPYNAFANAYFVRGQSSGPAFAPYGTPGSGWAYGYQDMPEAPTPKVNLPNVPGGYPAPAFAQSTVNAPRAQSTGVPTWLNSTPTANSGFSQDFLKYASTMRRG